MVKARLMRTIAVVGAGALVLTACGGDGDEAADSTPAAGGEGSAEIATGVGVTEEPCPDAVNEDNGCIYLGVISDLSVGAFASYGPEIVRGHEDYWKRVNEAGGIGGFDIDVSENIQDGEYDPQVYPQAYREIEPDILALAESLGTPQTQAILSDMEADNVVGATSTWWSGWNFEEEDNGLVLESGSSYCFHSMSALDWVSENREAPTSVVSVGFPTDFGLDYAAGVEKWAEANGVEVQEYIETGPNAAVGNQDGVVQRILEGQPDVVGLAVPPGEAAEIVGKAAAQGYTGTFLGFLASWNPALLGTDAAAAMEQLYLHVSTFESFGGSSEAHQAMIETYGEGENPPNDGYTFGWVSQYPIQAVLEKAAANGDLTREGVVAAVDGTEVDFEGALPTVTLGGDPNENVDRSVTINEVVLDGGEYGQGVRALETAYVGPTAEAYEYTSACTS
jgi:ABC-type branched-subunit amino acid transport system substrate-binding protein